ncbi:lipopolysaccharide biosynthesis protein [Sphingobacterium sp. G1-14]|uniref:lipopolysaccharide biosynthesis protein n=1 Tax=Sphingobacterium sp. G1-14 TaxID=2003121 RepID=UPI000B48A3E5|nr:hypothetical protein [Sphingobacterium sp. G1-14]
MNAHILKNIISRFFGLGVNLFNQVALIPLFIRFWGVDKYGDWIILSTIMSFFSMSNVGFNDVIANKFVVSFTEGRIDQCRKYLTNNYILLIFASIVCIFSLTIFILFFDISSILGTRVTPHKDIIFVVYFLFFQIITAQFSAVFNAIYRSVKKTYIAFYLEDGAKFAELIIMFICLYFNSSFSTVSVLLVLPKLLVWGYKIFDIPKYFDYKFYLKDFEWSFIKETSGPSLSFMAFPVGYAIMNQGLTLMVARNFSAEILILFNTTRTLCNFIKSFIGIFHASIWPEFSIAYGNKDYLMMRNLNRKLLFISIGVTLIIGAVLLLIGPYIYSIWLHNKITFDYRIMFSFLLSVFFGNIWYSSSVVLMSTNNHTKLGWYFLLLNITCIIAFRAIIIFSQSLPFALISLLIVDIPLSYYCMKLNLRITKDRIFDLFKVI